MPNIRNCANAFRQMTEQGSLKLSLFSRGEIYEKEILFTSAEFKHLSGLHKIEDSVRGIPQKSRTLLKSACNGDIPMSAILKSSKVVDDTGKTEQEKAELRREHKILKSDLISRLSAVENLSNQLQSVANGTSTLEVFSWDKDTRKEKRPNFSDIKADMLIEIQDSENSAQRTCFFVVENNKGALVGESIFLSPYTYSADNEENCQKRKNNGFTPEKVNQYEILSATLCSDTKELVLIQAPVEKLEKCLQIDAETKENKQLEERLKPLVQARKQYLSAEQEGNKYKIDVARFDYGRFFKNVALNKKMFPDDVVDKIKHKLETQLKSENNPVKRDCLVFEIDAFELVQMSRELCNAREAFAKDKTKEDEHLDKVISFVEKANTGYGDFAIAVLQKQKESYDTKEKQKLFSKKEIEELKQTIDKEIAMIDNNRDKGDIDKPRGNGGKKITPLVDKPSKTQSIKQIIQTKVSQFKKFVSNVKERISNYISSILNNPSSSGGSGSGTPYAYAGSGNSNGNCAVYAFGELKENPLLQNMCMSITQPTYTAFSAQTDIVNECSHLISLVENMAVMLKEDTHKAMREALKPAPKEVAPVEKKNKPRTAKKQTQYDYNDK